MEHSTVVDIAPKKKILHCCICKVALLVYLAGIIAVDVM